MRPSSLAFRLTVSAAIVSLVLLVSAGCSSPICSRSRSSAISMRGCRRCWTGCWPMSRSTRMARRSFSGRIADTRFKLPLVGLVLAGLAADGRPDHDLVSASLLENRLRPTADDLASMARDERHRAVLSHRPERQCSCAAIEQRFTLFGGKTAILLPGGRQFRRAEARDRLPSPDARRRAGGCWALGLLAAILVQVRYWLEAVAAPAGRTRRQSARRGAGAARRALSGGDRAGVDRAQSAASNPTPRSSIGRAPRSAISRMR